MYEQFQYSIIQFLQSFSGPGLDLFFQIINILGHPVFWFVVAAFFYWKGKERTTFHIINLLLFTTVIVGTLLLIFSLNYPFTWSVQVSKDPFRHALEQFKAVNLNK